MGFEHFLAALGATLFVSSQERKEQQLRERAANAQFQIEMSRQSALNAWSTGRGYNRARQNELTRLMNSTLLEDKIAFAKILGRPCSNNSTSISNAVRAIADKEGWTYFSENDLYYDPEYRRLNGWEPLSDAMVTEHQAIEKERRRKEQIWQEWAKKNPRCIAANVSPEFCESEEKFALVVNYEFYKWREGCYNYYAIQPGNYETKAEYEAALAARIEEMKDYEESFKRLGVTDTGIGRFSLCHQMDYLKKEWNDRPQNIPLEYYFYISYFNHCVPKYGKTVGMWERECYEVLLVTARKNGIDLDKVIDQGEAGTLFPEGTRGLKNYYLSCYFMSGTGELYTLHSSDYYRRKFGFTLEDFSRHCGKNPDFHFSPPITRNAFATCDNEKE